MVSKIISGKYVNQFTNKIFLSIPLSIPDKERNSTEIPHLQFKTCNKINGCWLLECCVFSVRTNIAGKPFVKLFSVYWNSPLLKASQMAIKTIDWHHVY